MHPSSVLLFEGVGAAQRALDDFIDATVWVQSDYETAELRGIERDIASGVNGDGAQSVSFWHEWMAQEIPFFERERPWERATAIVAGTSTAVRDPDFVKVARHSAADSDHPERSSRGQVRLDGRFVER